MDISIMKDTIMENVQKGDFVLRISALWGDQKRRENLYLEALKKDSMSPLRRVLTQGHFSAVLFQKEIRWIYDYVKCLLTDKELGELPSENLNQTQMGDLENKEQITTYLKKNEGLVLQSYNSLVSSMELGSEARRVLGEHVDRISEFYEILSKQELGKRHGVAF
ncbi:hypothetical protein [Dyadobacter sp. CY312]|uniref:hypothetical protein n=1 Tax=Dyadobacter sp. CY312 TaxID=2907303 RepID=UPI001F2DC5DC|nr:hypothetical protein [Dyadobacter sp. CY312]MCE7040905.1 hypothetical protein [Dyadobacter sp. CY312]